MKNIWRWAFNNSWMMTKDPTIDKEKKQITFVSGFQCKNSYPQGVFDFYSAPDVILEKWICHDMEKVDEKTWTDDDYMSIYATYVYSYKEMEELSLSSSGQDIALSRHRPGFESP